MNIRPLPFFTIALLFFLVLGPGFSGAQTIIGGTIATEWDEAVGNVPVFLSGDIDAVTLTDAAGTYQFSVPAGGSYTVTPSSNSIPINGLSTLDAVLLIRHIEGLQLLDSPYKMIAADVDNSGNIDLADSTALVHLFLGITLEFPNNTSWRFIDASYEFEDPQNPWLEAFPEMIFLNELESDQSGLDFVAIKVGDLNGTALTQLDVGPCDISCGFISGNVTYDLNENCAFDADEDKLQNWIVTIASATEVYHAATNQFGQYTIPVIPGEYTVTISPPNDLWEACQNSQLISVGELEEISVDFSVQAAKECPALTVDLSAAFLRRCFDGFYFVHYCNQGTIAAIDASVEVAFDPFLIVSGSSIPWSAQDGNTFTFELGDIAAGECGSFSVSYTVSCDAVLGQTHCSEAHIFPDSLCGPAPASWDGSTIELSGRCNADSVRFELINTGDPMIQPVEYLVIEDDMIMMMNDPLQLGAQESRTVSVPANGSTWRMEVDQSPDHPLAERLSAAIEGCGTDGTGDFSLGFVTQFPQYVPHPSSDIDCVENIGAYDPNDKRAIPAGVHEEHFIERNTDLDYHIRFQNTGTDTAFNVIIRDTLSEWLDITSVRPGASSHAYHFYLKGENIVEFYFPDILLPDSNVNEPASHGFVRFSVAQQPDNSLGTVIENEAAIYFDFNEPVITNRVYHTIGENFLEIVSNIIPPGEKDLGIKIYPNPMGASGFITLEGAHLEKGSFLLYDLNGRQIRRQAVSGNTFTFHKNELASGLYLFEIWDQDRRLSSGKLMIR